MKYLTYFSGMASLIIYLLTTWHGDAPYALQFTLFDYLWIFCTFLFYSTIKHSCDNVAVSYI